MIAVELGARWPSLVGGVVGVDPGPIDLVPASARVYDAFAAAMDGSDGEAARRLYVVETAGPTADAELAARIVETMCAVRLAVARAVIENVTSWNGAGALGLCEVPVLVIRSAPSTTDEPARLLRLKPDVQLGLTVGAGHFNHLEVPEQVNAMIDRFLALSFDPR